MKNIAITKVDGWLDFRVTDSENADYLKIVKYDPTNIKKITLDKRKINMFDIAGKRHGFSGVDLADAKAKFDLVISLL